MSKIMWQHNVRDLHPTGVMAFLMLPLQGSSEWMFPGPCWIGD